MTLYQGEHHGLYSPWKFLVSISVINIPRNFWFLSRDYHEVRYALEAHMSMSARLLSYLLVKTDI